MDSMDKAVMVLGLALFAFLTICVVGLASSRSYIDNRAVKTCSPYPTYASFERDDVKYAVCVEPDAGLVAKRIEQ